MFTFVLACIYVDTCNSVVLSGAQDCDFQSPLLGCLYKKTELLKLNLSLALLPHFLAESSILKKFKIYLN